MVVVTACYLFAIGIAVASGLLPSFRTDSYFFSKALISALDCFAALTYWEVGLAPNAGRFFMYYFIIFLIHSE